MLFYILLLPLIFVVYRSSKLVRHYITARKYGLPIILLPVSFEDAWWIPMRPLFAWVERLPFGLGSWYVYSEIGWPTVDGYRTVQRLGENFVLVAPTRIEVVTCYSPALELMIKDHKHWPQPAAHAQLFAVYGQNVSSTNGADWQRHRRITGSAFNESCMAQTWQEGIRAAKVVDFDAEKVRTLARIRSTFDVLAMKVLAAVGFGHSIELTAVPPGHKESLMESLGFILKNIMLTIVFHGLKAPSFLLPKVLRKLKVSVNEFQLYMEEIVLQHMQNSKSTNPSARPTSLLEAIIRANETEKQMHDKSAVGGKPSYLTDSELYGNLFVFNLAGYETTASSMTFALPFLAAHPEVQAWVTEEVEKHFANNKDIEADYTTIFPQMVRTLAVMYETLRFATPAPLLVRSPEQPTPLPVTTPDGPSTITIYPDVLVGLHTFGAHLSPRWGPDANAFNPKRYITTSPSGDETFAIPANVLHMPWIFGPRVCPGKKFSQVEFVAMVAQILSQYRIEVWRQPGADPRAAKANLQRVMDGKYFNVSTHLRHGEAAAVVFVKR